MNPSGASKKILYVDLDNTMVNFQSGIDRLTNIARARYEHRFDEAPGIFALMEPIDGALEAYRTLSEVFDTYILSTSPWKNPGAGMHKFGWVQEHLGVSEGTPAHKRVILSHHKNLNRGDLLVDDRGANGASEFEGKWIEFGSEPFPNWATVTAYLMERR